MKTADLKFTELCEEIDQLKDQLITEKLLYSELEDKYTDLVMSTVTDPEDELKRNTDLISYGRDQMIEKIKKFQPSEILQSDINRIELYQPYIINVIKFYKLELLKELEK